MVDTNQVVLIGLDGLGYSEIKSWINDESLSELNKLYKNNSEINLESTQPPWTPCAWPSLLSGRNPGKHGVFDFFTREGYSKRLINQQDVDAPYLFEAASSEGLTSVVINFPVTHPASEISGGAVVPGYLADESVSFHPEKLREEYEEEYGEYIIYPEYGADEDAVAQYIDVARCRRDMARFLDSEYEWDLMAVQFQVTDSVFHDLEGRDDIRQVLEGVDRFVGDIIKLGGNDSTVLVASDHGMGDYDWTFYINSWLAQNDYCQVTEGESQYFRQQKSALKGSKESEKRETAAEMFVKTIAESLSRVGLSPQRIHSGLSAVGAAKIVEHLLPSDALVAAQNQVVDYQNSCAFQIYFNSLGVHLNVKGQHPSGVIEREDYEAVRSQLIEELKQVRDPEGELVFDDVQPREEVYHGRNLKHAPDVILTPRDFRYDVSGSILDIFRKNSHKNHKPEGILLSNRPLNVGNSAEIYDVAPTVAAALGISVDAQTDGSVLLDTEERRNRRDWDKLAGKFRRRETETDTQSVEDRLANLGYME